MENWNKFINEMLTNKDNGNIRSVEPFDVDDKKNIISLSSLEALIIWSSYFSDTIKYASQFERTYGEPVETLIFDENDIDSNSIKEILKTLHDEVIPILIYWNSNIAIKTTWKMLTKYWDNFFYHPEDAIIYVNQEQVYFYNEMMLKKINKLNLKSISGESVFEHLKKLEDKKTLKSNALDSLLEGFSTDVQDSLYSLFNKISEGFKVIENDEMRKEYMQYCIGTIWSDTEKIVLACKPYNEKSNQNFIKDLDEKKKIFDKSSKENFHELLKKIASKN